MTKQLNIEQNKHIQFAKECPVDFISTFLKYNLHKIGVMTMDKNNECNTRTRQCHKHALWEPQYWPQKFLRRVTKCISYKIGKQIKSYLE